MVSKSSERNSISTGHARRDAILRVIPELETSFGRAPSLREIADAVNVRSHNAVREHIARLLADGLVVKDDNGRVHVVRDGQQQPLVDESAPVLEKLSKLQLQRRQLDAQIDDLAVKAKIKGASWAEVGQALGGLGHTTVLKRYRDKVDREVSV